MSESSLSDIQRFQVHYSLKEVPEVQDFLNDAFERSKHHGDLQDLYRRRYGHTILLYGITDWHFVACLLSPSRQRTPRPRETYASFSLGQTVLKLVNNPCQSLDQIDRISTFYPTIIISLPHLFIFSHPTLRLAFFPSEPWIILSCISLESLYITSFYLSCIFINHLHCHLASSAMHYQPLPYQSVPVTGRRRLQC
jgi:hypothetical protein